MEENQHITLDDIKYDEKKVSETAKKLMVTLHMNVSDSIKLHLEKAYAIGYNDAVDKIKKTIKLKIENI
jgi:hypothetical protein